MTFAIFSTRSSPAATRQRWLLTGVCQFALLLALLPAAADVRANEANAGFAKEAIEYVSSGTDQVRLREQSQVTISGANYSHKIVLDALARTVTTSHRGHRLSNGLLAPLHC